MCFKLLLAVLVHFPDVLHDVIHRPPVGEFHLELDSLTRRFDVHKNVEQCRDQLQPEFNQFLSFSKRTLGSLFTCQGGS